MNTHIIVGIISGIITGSWLYIADSYSPKTAGFLAAFPLPLITMILVNKSIVNEVSRSFITSLTFYALSVLLFCFLIRKNFNQTKAVCISFMLWLLACVIAWNCMQ